MLSDIYMYIKHPGIPGSLQLTQVYTVTDIPGQFMYLYILIRNDVEIFVVDVIVGYNYSA